MNLNVYHQSAQEFANYPIVAPLAYPTLGLAGEAGELANKVKKVIRDDNSQLTSKAKQAIILELGDCLWYISAIAGELGVSLDTVARLNLTKLRDRQRRGKISGSGDNR